MKLPIDIDPRQFSLFNPDSFTRLCNDLLVQEARAKGILPDNIDTTVRTRQPDGGIDARIDPAGRSIASDWLSDRISVWQFKSGACPSARDFRRKELKKPLVKKAMTNGESYCLLTAESLTDQKKRAIEEAIFEEYRSLGQPPCGRIISADRMADWILEFPSLAVKHFNVPLVGWVTHD